MLFNAVNGNGPCGSQFCAPQLDDVENTLFVPGIQVDRGTENLGKVEDYILHALEFAEDRHYDGRTA
jgi:hypothetical protein